MSPLNLIFFISTCKVSHVSQFIIRLQITSVNKAYPSWTSGFSQTFFQCLILPGLQSFLSRSRSVHIHLSVKTLFSVLFCAWSFTLTFFSDPVRKIYFSVSFDYCFYCSRMFHRRVRKRLVLEKNCRNNSK